MHLRLATAFLLLAILPLAHASSNNSVVLYFFWGEGCPHCAEEEPFLASLEQKYPQLEVRAFEVWHHPGNASLFSNISKAFRASLQGVPTTFIGDRAIVGYQSDATTGAEIERAISECIQNGCLDPSERLNGSESNASGAETIDVPLLGKIDSSRVALPLFTLVIAGLDSFNPCAFFILFFLLSMLVSAESRKRMLFVGGVFVFFSAFIYFLFMAAWLNIFLFIGQIALITTVAGAIALAMALLNIKDYFFLGSGPSLSIPKSAHSDIFKRMRALLKAEDWPAMMVGTVFLAITANTYELLCTAGFPMVFTRVLTLNHLSSFEYYLYLAVYNVVYVLPLALIVAFFVFTLGARRLSEFEAKLLKLVSGTMMLLISLVLLFSPALLSNLFTGVGILLASLALSAVIVMLTKDQHKQHARHHSKNKAD